MGIVLRWREEPLDCELVTGTGGATLSVRRSDGELVCREPVPSAAAACERARQIRERLGSGHRKHA